MGLGSAGGDFSMCSKASIEAFLRVQHFDPRGTPSAIARMRRGAARSGLLEAVAEQGFRGGRGGAELRDQRHRQVEALIGQIPARRCLEAAAVRTRPDQGVMLMANMHELDVVSGQVCSCFGSSHCVAPSDRASDAA